MTSGKDRNPIPKRRGVVRRGVAGGVLRESPYELPKRSRRPRYDRPSETATSWGKTNPMCRSLSMGLQINCGFGPLAGLQPSKLAKRVRFAQPAPRFPLRRSSTGRAAASKSAGWRFDAVRRSHSFFRRASIAGDAPDSYSGDTRFDSSAWLHAGVAQWQSARIVGEMSRVQILASGSISSTPGGPHEAARHHP